jgi:hypothetical protein
VAEPEYVVRPPDGLWRGELIHPERTVPIELHLTFEDTIVRGFYDIRDRLDRILVGSLSGTYEAPKLTMSSTGREFGTFSGVVERFGPEYKMSGTVTGRRHPIEMTASYDLRLQSLEGSWDSG